MQRQTDTKTIHAVFSAQLNGATGLIDKTVNQGHAQTGFRMSRGLKGLEQTGLIRLRKACP